jgi:Protein of unknown function (DUF3572)
MKADRRSSRRVLQPSRSPAGKARVGADRSDAAFELAVAALGFLASERDELSRFLALTGIDPRSIRTAAEEPGFLGGVLAYIAGSESTLLAFAAHARVAPQEIEEARAILTDAEWNSDTP